MDLCPLRSVRIDSILNAARQCLCSRAFDTHHVRTPESNRQPTQSHPQRPKRVIWTSFGCTFGWVCSIFTYKYSSTPPHKSSSATNVNPHTNTPGGHQPAIPIPVCKCMRYIISHIYAHIVLEMLSIHTKTAPAHGPEHIQSITYAKHPGFVCP